VTYGDYLFVVLVLWSLSLLAGFLAGLLTGFFLGYLWRG